MKIKMFVYFCFILFVTPACYTAHELNNCMEDVNSTTSRFERISIYPTNVTLCLKKTHKNELLNVVYKKAENKENVNYSSMIFQNLTLQTEGNDAVSLRELEPNTKYNVCVSSNLTFSDCLEVETKELSMDDMDSIQDLRILEFDSDRNITFNTLMWEPPINYQNYQDLKYEIKYCDSNLDETNYDNGYINDSNSTSTGYINDSNSTSTDGTADTSYNNESTTSSTLMTAKTNDNLDICSKYISWNLTKNEDSFIVPDNYSKICVRIQETNMTDACLKLINVSAKNFNVTNNETFITIVWPEDNNQVNNYTLQISCKNYDPCNDGCLSFNQTTYYSSIEEINIPKEIKRSDGHYEARLFLEINPDNPDESVLVGKQEFQMKSTKMDPNETVEKDSVIIEWNIPTMKKPLDITLNYSNSSSHTDSITFYNFIGCSWKHQINELMPYTNYSWDLAANINTDRRSRTLFTKLESQGSGKTKSAVCNRVTEFTVKEDSSSHHAIVKWNLSDVVDGKLNQIKVTFTDKKSEETAEINPSDNKCNITTGCLLKDITIEAERNYTVNVTCKHEGTEEGAGKKKAFNSLARVPSNINHAVIDVKELTERYVSGNNSLTFNVELRFYDTAVGTIRHRSANYGMEEYLGDFKCTQGLVKNESELPSWILEKKLMDDGIKFKLENLNSSTNYVVFVRYANDVGYACSNILRFRTPASRTGRTAYVVLILVVFLSLWMQVIYSSRKTKKDSLNFDIEDLPFNPSFLNEDRFKRPICKKTNKEILQKLLKIGSTDLKVQYFSINQNIFRDKTPISSIGKLPINAKKNRYTDIISYDFSRVVLQDDENENDGSYINASYIHGYKKSCAFIACQGPLTDTVYDFWRMILEKNVKVIVMLTECIENGRERCNKYWPSSMTTPTYTNSDMVIQLLHESTDALEKCIVRKFLVCQGWKTQKVIHYHCTWWPDKKCPTISQIIPLATEIKKYTHTQESPIVVHCSAGVGRTGVLIGLLNIMEEIDDPEKGTVDVFHQVIQMRYMRTMMVQTHEQFQFLHRCVKHLLKSKSSVRTTETLTLERRGSIYSNSSEDLEPLSSSSEEEDEKVSKKIHTEQIVENNGI